MLHDGNVHFEALATDFDGTLAHDGAVSPGTVAALERLRSAGLRLVLVTGRLAGELREVFPQLAVFDLVVAENGGLLYDPRRSRERALAGPPDPRFVAALRKRRVEPLAVGRVIVATREPYGDAVLAAMHEVGLELELSFNKGAIMILPPGVTKASGLLAACDELGIRPASIVAVGDAENDLSFMHASGLAVAVANALPAVKLAADLVTTGSHGDGVTELAARLLAGELDGLAQPAERGRPVPR